MLEHRIKSAVQFGTSIWIIIFTWFQNETNNNNFIPILEIQIVPPYYTNLGIFTDYFFQKSDQFIK